MKRRRPPGWRPAWLTSLWVGRLLGLHSQSRHAFGTCWCQR